jgi:hypothetical protein
VCPYARELELGPQVEVRVRRDLKLRSCEAATIWGELVLWPPSEETVLRELDPRPGAEVTVSRELDLRPSLRTMCGSRTGGWSLPCLMSD